MAQARLCWSRLEVPGVLDHPATILSTFWARVSAGTVPWMLESRRHAYGRLPCERGPEAQGLVPTLPSVPEAQICSRYFMSSGFRCTTLQRLMRESNGRRSDRLLQGQPTGAATASRYKGAPSLRDYQGPPAGWRREEHDIRMAQSPSAA